jgi:hypothetical protein
VHAEGRWLVHGGHQCARRQRRIGRRSIEGGWGGVCVTFPPRIHLPLQATSLGLCEPPLGSSLSSRAARLKDFVMSLGGNKAEKKRKQSREEC